MGSSCFMISCFIPGRTQDRLKIYIKQLVTRDTWWTQWPSEDHYICIQIPQTDFHWKPRKYACDEYCLLKSFFNPIFFHHPKSRIGSGIRILDWIFRIIMKKGAKYLAFKRGKCGAPRIHQKQKSCLTPNIISRRTTSSSSCCLKAKYPSPISP